MLRGRNAGFSFSIRNSRSTGKEPASYFKGKQLSDYSSDLTMDALQRGDSAMYLCAGSSIAMGHRHPFMRTPPHISLSVQLPHSKAALLCSSFPCKDIVLGSAVL